MPGQLGAPGKEGLIGPKVRGLSAVDIRGVGMGKESHDRVVRLSGEGRCRRLGHCGVEWNQAEVSG